MAQQQKRLFIINGFLGAGKTTLVQQLLRLWPEHKTAVIVNEFGKKSLDGPVLQQCGISIVEINNGSIFCSCRSDSFVAALLELAKTDAYNVVVESSGLSNPSGMGKLVPLVQKLSDGAYDYRGSVTLVDAQGFEDVRHTSAVQRLQVAAADLLLLNKTDLVEEADVRRLETILHELNPYASIVRTTFAQVDAAVLDALNSGYSMQDHEFSGGQVIGTQKLLFALCGDFRYEDVAAWLSDICPHLYRIKGFVQISGEWHYIDSTSKSIIIKPASFVPEEPVTVLLAAGSQPVKKHMNSAWHKYMHDDQELVFE